MKANKMPSRTCPICGRTTTCNHTPMYCAWGCGKFEDTQRKKEKEQEQWKPEQIQQMKLF